MGGIGVAASGIAGGYGVKEGLFKFEGDSRTVDRYFKDRGFPNHQITKDRFLELSPYYADTLLGPREAEINIVNDSEVLAEVFVKSSQDLVSLEVTDEHSTPGNLSVVETQYNELEYQTVIVGTDTNQSARLNLGTVSDSSYLRIMRTPASQDTQIPSDGVRLHNTQADPLYQAIIQCTPTMGMRRDNYLNFLHAIDEDSQKIALTNDMLLHYPVEIRENDKGEVAIIYWGLNSAEDGGRGRNPIALYNDFDNRVYDVDIVQVAIVNDKFQLTELAHQEDNKYGSHQMAIDYISREGVPPFDQNIHSVPNHGLVGRGLGKINDEEIKKVWRPYPVIDILLDDADRSDMYQGARVVALNENIGESERRLEALYKEPPIVNIYAISDLETRRDFLKDKLILEFEDK